MNTQTVYEFSPQLRRDLAAGKWSDDELLGLARELHSSATRAGFTTYVSWLLVALRSEVELHLFDVVKGPMHVNYDTCRFAYCAIGDPERCSEVVRWKINTAEYVRARAEGMRTNPEGWRHADCDHAEGICSWGGRP